MIEWFSTHAFLSVVAFCLIAWLALEGLLALAESGRTDICGQCWGNGTIPNINGAFDDEIVCPKCNGKKFV